MAEIILKTVPSVRTLSIHCSHTKIPSKKFLVSSEHQNLMKEERYHFFLYSPSLCSSNLKWSIPLLGPSRFQLRIFDHKDTMSLSSYFQLKYLDAVSEGGKGAYNYVLVGTNILIWRLTKLFITERLEFATRHLKISSSIKKMRSSSHLYSNICGTNQTVSQGIGNRFCFMTSPTNIGPAGVSVRCWNS